MKRRPLQGVLVSLFVFLVLVVLSISLGQLLNLEDGFTTFAVTLSAILTAYLLLLTRLRSISDQLGLSDGPGTGITGGSLSVSSIGSSLSRSIRTLGGLGASLLLDSERSRDLLVLLKQEVATLQSERRKHSAELIAARSEKLDIVVEDEDSDDDLGDT